MSRFTMICKDHPGSRCSASQQVWGLLDWGRSFDWNSVTLPPNLWTSVRLLNPSGLSFFICRNEERKITLQSCSLWRLMYEKRLRSTFTLSLSCLYSFPFPMKWAHFFLVTSSFQCCLEFSRMWKHPQSQWGLDKGAVLWFTKTPKSPSLYA